MSERLVVLRDDDVNATTPVDKLARAYRPLLAEGHKICFSTIPKLDTTTPGPSGQRESFIVGEPAEPFPALHHSSEFVAWQRENAAQAEVAMHGVTHSRVRGGTEFGSLDFAEAATRLDEGIRIITEAFGRPARSFVAPWDALSRGSLQAAAERFEIISTCFLDRRRLPVQDWPKHYLERLRQQMLLPVGGSWVLRHQGGLTPDATPDDIPRVIQRVNGGALVTVIVLHHWMFWGTGEHPAILALSRQLQGLTVVTLGEVADRLRQLGRIGWMRLCLWKA
jgi:hypothetical protein